MKIPETRHTRLRGNDEFLGLLDKSGLIIVLPASFFIFLLPLPMASIGLLRSLFLALRPWWVLLTLCSPWLLPLIMDCRASLLRRGLDWG